jgi:hypothetical protein
VRGAGQVEGWDGVGFFGPLGYEEGVREGKAGGKEEGGEGVGFLRVSGGAGWGVRSECIWLVSCGRTLTSELVRCPCARARLFCREFSCS